MTTLYPIDALTDDVAAIAQRAREAAYILGTLPAKVRNEILLAAAHEIERRHGDILAENQKDCAAAEVDLNEGRMSSSMFKRLRTTERGIAEMAGQVREVAALEDPLGRTLDATELDDGLTLYKVSCPIGVVGVVFESRPDVVTQVGSLAIKSGNALLLKGGREALNTNRILVSLWRDVLSGFSEVPIDAINLLETREDVSRMLSLHSQIDLIIPRGSKDFVHYITKNSSIPVLGHGDGVCHVYVDRDADLRKAAEVAFDSKVQYPAVCNAMETLLVHEEIAESFLPRIVSLYRSAGVEIRGCSESLRMMPDEIVPATELDWSSEYGDLIVSLKIVKSSQEAIEHINRYGSGHTESIITENSDLANHFMNRVDAAGVYHNASTRFADGYRYGFGAEVGISTSKLHARGPMGMDGLTTYKYKLYGNGHIVATYASGERSFKHRKLTVAKS
jgi:glutamate-5-semialdehyde dehydrogenase